MQAQEETEEAIKEGNHRYNSMLNERMNKEDNLRRSIESIKLEMASKDSVINALQHDLDKQGEEAGIAHARQHKAWEEERRAAAVRHEQVSPMATTFQCGSTTKLASSADCDWLGSRGGDLV